MAHLTVARSLERLEVVKGSKFYAFVTPLANLEQVTVQLEQMRKTYPEASHHCYAFRYDAVTKFSDDGEPGGTAGRPMLETLVRRGLDHTLAIVTRYFGGTKLGAGGLVRAYSGSLAKALDEAGVLEVKDRHTLAFCVPFAEADAVHRFIAAWPELTHGAPNYSASGLELEVTLLAQDRDRFKTALVDLSRGQVRWRSPQH